MLRPEEAASTEYDTLPEPVKQVVGRREWAWLSDAEKATLVQRECEPDE
jgi:hypothetical protein